MFPRVFPERRYGRLNCHRDFPSHNMILHQILKVHFQPVASFHWYCGWQYLPLKRCTSQCCQHSDLTFPKMVDASQYLFRHAHHKHDRQRLWNNSFPTALFPDWKAETKRKKRLLPGLFFSIDGELTFRQSYENKRTALVEKRFFLKSNYSYYFLISAKYL